jgi:signal transduction histidine kinase
VEQWERLLNDLKAELTVREQELDLLHEIDLRLLEPEQPPQELFDFIVHRTMKLLQSSNTTILLRRSTFLEPMYSTLKSIIGQRVAISESLTGLCLETDEVVNVADLTVRPYSDRYTLLRGYRGSPMLSLLSTPIQIRGTTVGVLNAESRTAAAFKPVHERISAAIAAQVAIALQRTQTLDSTVLFADVDRLMFASDDTDDTQAVIQTALERVMAELQRLEHVEHSGAQITFLRGQGELEIVHSTNPLDVGLTLPVAKSVSGRAVRERKTIIVGDVSKDPEYQRMLGDSIRSEIAVPILFGEDDIVVGVLNVESEEEDAFYGFYQVVLESFADKVKTLLAFAKLRADVTEALELRSADDLLAAVGDQTSHLIHRLNNTVGAMRLKIMGLQDRLDDGRLEGRPDRLRKSLAELLDLAERTLKMPDEVTQVLGQGGTSVDVNACVRRALGQVEPPKSIQVALDLDETIPALPLYSFDIVVQNLIQNGIDAMPTGGRLTISTSAVNRPTLATGYFQLMVRDTGVGMPADVQRRVFELNFTTKHERGKGLGLGLWWVRNFVRRTRGDITIRSSVGRGTEVTVKIPIDRPSRISAAGRA